MLFSRWVLILYEYKKYIENDGALDRRFQKLEIKEPDKTTVKDILMKLKSIYEKHHSVVISEIMIDKIIYYTNKYIKDRNEPDKSIDILDEVCSKVSLKLSSNEEKIIKMKSNLKEIINILFQMTLRKHININWKKII